MASSRPTHMLVLVVAVVAIVGAAVVAATIGSVVVFDVGGDPVPGPPPGDTGIDWPDGDGEGDGDGIFGDTVPPLNLVVCIKALTEPASIFGILGGLFGLLYLTYLRLNLSTAVLVGTFLVPFTMLGYFLLTNCPGDVGTGDPWPRPPVDPTDTPFAWIEGTPAIPSALVGLLLAGVLVVAVAVLFSMGRQDEPFASDETTVTYADPDYGDFARAARRARERIEQANVPVDNAVYQAWMEMTGLLALDRPETTTPREFAAAAIDLGLAEPDVLELTALFTDVRYGDKNPATREDRAVAVLRNIEETYRASPPTGDGSNTTT